MQPKFDITLLNTLHEEGAANDIIIWTYRINENTSLAVSIERDGKTEISLENNNGTISHENLTLHAVELSLKRLTEITEAITHWRNIYKPITLKDDVIDFWFTDKGDKEVETILTVPWLIQQQGSKVVRKFIEDKISDYQGSGFTQVW